MSAQKSPRRSRSLPHAAGRAALWSLLSVATWLEGVARRQGRPPRPLRPSWPAESSSGRYRFPCAVGAGEPARVPATRQAHGGSRTASWKRGTLGVFIGSAFLGGALVGQVQGHLRFGPGSQVAIADPSAPGPGRITAADRAALARCVEASTAPERSDRLSVAQPATLAADRAAGVLRRGDGEKPIVSLTFDDGPNPDTTPRVLEALRQEGVPATFFLIGSEVERYPELARQVVAEGHAVGNHTWHHFYLNHLDAGSTASEMEITSRVIEKVTGARPRWFRPPGGTYSPDVLHSARGLGQRVVLWSQDSRDWTGPGQAAIRRRVLADLRPGAVILLHDTSPQTAAVLASLVREIKARGYRFVPLEELK